MDHYKSQEISQWAIRKQFKYMDDDIAIAFQRQTLKVKKPAEAIIIIFRQNI